MRVSIGADHRGHDALQQLLPLFEQRGIAVAVIADCGGDVCDYPDMAIAVCRSVLSGDAERGVLLCGTGMGSCLAANKLRGIRAAQAQDEIAAETARGYLDVNVLCLAADLLGPRLLERIVTTFLETPFAGGRHEKRLEKILALEAD
ncbi:RpiB/LacA/LacB family sugar-phosphate isomerase [Phycisphaera mikurensis]|uniref:Ribose-5-phosphate isomerase B n=1 Tax=Phycisphaera mikurensis (strain NBRC 102666 / KCTC 22515 / FYK2301M01) TaxID=1142394 RepID=I0IGR2_PHYMF|nr:RpiB/LacA/LacB family sugar-phosphate isomerase [Phycisphaera mikurensis]MBB6443239.1 ribose 5-phosphate isomerase B [Phycisphaera mikurensis]BAM04450.1 ribose-5-phosphate isomerase B [Phycisphaera mikurensis NBRC 102666]